MGEIKERRRADPINRKPLPSSSSYLSPSLPSALPSRMPLNQRRASGTQSLSSFISFVFLYHIRRRPVM